MISLKEKFSVDVDITITAAFFTSKGCLLDALVISKPTPSTAFEAIAIWHIDRL
jgi:hypothetical protein